MVTKKRVLIIFGCFLALAAVVFFVNAAHVCLLYQREALDCTWLASLSYMQATGEIPKSVNDLFRQEYLRQKGEYVSLWVPNRKSGKFTGVADMKYIRLNFPAEDQGRLIDTKTGKEWFIVSTEFWLFPTFELRELNLSYWQQWNQYEKGEKVKYCGFEFVKPSND